MSHTTEPSLGTASTSEQIDRLAPWFHNLHLPDGTQTAPNHFLGDFPNTLWQHFADHLPADLRGWSVLDIGCNAGFYSIELARRGAEVFAIDHDPHYLAQAQWAVRQFGLEQSIQIEQEQVYDLARDDRQFDLVLFMGVFYHLRYPLLALDMVAQRVRQLMVFQTLMTPEERVVEPPDDLPLSDRAALTQPGWPAMAFIEHRLSGDPTNWWATNRAGVEAMLRSAGFSITSRPHPEVYFCKPDEPATRQHANELSAATNTDR